MQPREKLKLFLDTKGLTNSQFAEIVTKPRQYITNILNGTKNFGLDFVIVLGYKFPDLDLNWLLKDDTGNSEYSVVETSTSNVSEPKNKYENKSICKECENKDKIINRYEKLCDSQEKTIQRLEAELLSLMEKNKKTG